MATTGIALLGAGNFAKGAHLPAIARAPTLALKAVYSRSESSAQSLADAAKDYPSITGTVDTYYDVPEAPGKGLDAMLAREDIKAVVLSLPILFQPTMIEKAWKAGKSVISEKPVAENLDEAKRLIALYESEYKPKGIMWIVAEQFPYEEAFVIAKSILDSGKIGELRSFTLDYNNMIAPGNKTHETAWRKTCAFQGGFILDGGVHFIAGLRHMLPSPLAKLSAFVTQVQPHLAPSDLLHAIVETETGVQGSVRISWGIESTVKRLYSFYGPLGRVEVDFSPYEDNKFVVTTTLVGQEPEVVKAVAEAVVQEFAYFGKALLAGPGSAEAEDVERRSGPRATLKDLAVIQGALSSKGSPVDVIALLGEYKS
ncbi:NAD dependent oxidoreductase [Pseudohyphozyma bogoriensis]|nr:NAD dependent oxidoreductase [Pseudohyphozyma bogoriensis]